MALKKYMHIVFMITLDSDKYHCVVLKRVLLCITCPALEPPVVLKERAPFDYLMGLSIKLQTLPLLE